VGDRCGMSVLSSAKILERLHANGRQRLVIAPLLSMEEQLRDSQASIDVRLGCHFSLAEPTTKPSIDTFSPKRPEAPRRRVYIPIGDSIILHPHQFLLGETLEFVRLPPDLMAYVVGRSSWGREGLVVATAVGVHPEYAGIVTLELRNLGEIPICLYPGSPIAQLFLHDVAGPVEDRVGRGSQFSGSTSPAPGELTYDLTHKKLSALRTPPTAP
jgi:dCTP deaminase